MLLDIRDAAFVVVPDSRKNNQAYPGIVWRVSKGQFAAACGMSNHGLKILLDDSNDSTAFFPLRKMAAKALIEHSKHCMF